MRSVSYTHLLNKVEEDGYAVNGAIAALGMRAKLRGLRTNDGLPIFKSDMQGTTPYALDGAPMYFPENGSFDKTIAQMIVGDFRQLVWAIRQDITVKILDQGVIQDPVTKAIQYNLAQQDMIAIRVVFRAGWALPNPATRLNEDRTGCAFAYLEPATPVTTQTVTITVKDGSNESAKAVKGASVDVNGSILKTNDSGVDVYKRQVQAAVDTDNLIFKAAAEAGLLGSVTDTSELISKFIADGVKSTNGELRNFARMYAADASKLYEHAVDQAYLQLSLIHILSAQSRAMQTLTNMIKQYDAMVDTGMANQEQRARIELLRAQVNKLTGTAQEIEDLSEAEAEVYGCLLYTSCIMSTISVC